eukprot:PhF_6_TR36205/c1_g1_i4/m.52824
MSTEQSERWLQEHLPHSCFPAGVRLLYPHDKSFVFTNAKQTCVFVAMIPDPPQSYRMNIVGYSTEPTPNDGDTSISDALIRTIAEHNIREVHFRSMECSWYNPVIAKIHAGGNLLKTHAPVLCNIHFLADTVALPTELVLPSGYTCRRLFLSDADTVNDNWPHKGPGTIVGIRYQIEKLTCFGVEGPTGGLVAWVLETNYAGFGQLHTSEECRRKGIAKFLVVEISK